MPTRIKKTNGLQKSNEDWFRVQFEWLRGRNAVPWSPDNSQARIWSRNCERCASDDQQTKFAFYENGFVVFIIFVECNKLILFSCFFNLALCMVSLYQRRRLSRCMLIFKSSANAAIPQQPWCCQSSLKSVAFWGVPESKLWTFESCFTNILPLQICHITKWRMMSSAIPQMGRKGL